MKVLSWNVHGFVGAGGVFDPERIAETVRRINPMIAAFQEIDLRRHDAEVLAPLVQAIGPHSAQALAMGDATHWYGQLVVSRYPIDIVRVHDISYERAEPRRILDVTLKTEFGQLRVLATHFGLSRRERLHQQREMRQRVAADPRTPTIVIGDFNEWRPIWGAARRMIGPGAGISSAQLRTFPALFPLFPLDRVAAFPARLLKQAMVDRKDPGASDHLPLVAELEPGILTQPSGP